MTLAVLYVGYRDEWTLNALLTTSSSYRECSKRQILGPSAQATSLLQIEGTTKCSHIARGFSFGSVMACAAEPNPQYSGWAKRRARPLQEFRLIHLPSTCLAFAGRFMPARTRASAATIGCTRGTAFQPTGGGMQGTRPRYRTCSIRFRSYKTSGRLCRATNRRAGNGCAENRDSSPLQARDLER